jgi:transcriptional regulator GlxA family with amidase domain
MALYVVGRLKGAEIAAKTARQMEYDHYQPT